MKSLNLVFSVICLLAALPASAQGDADAGKGLYAICQTCHGANGEGMQAMNAPRIAGMAAWELRRQLDAYRSGPRGTHPDDTFGAQMRPMAATLADAQAVDNVIAYIRTLEAPKPAVTVAGDAGAGQGAYAICGTCHGQNGEGMEAMNAPRLAGQHDWYIVRQLQNFKSGVRGRAAGDTYGAQMWPMAMTLATDEAVNNVAAYLATLD